MTIKDTRTPASDQDRQPIEGEQSQEAGKSVGWHKGYVGGSRPDLRVPVRQVHLTNGKSVSLYDTSGPYTDPQVDTDVRRGLAPLRDNWIIARGDTEEYAGRPSARRTTESSTPRRVAGSGTSTRCSPGGPGSRAGAGTDRR